MKICTAKQTPKREPKIHHEDKLDGAGRSTDEVLMIFRSEWVFLMSVIRILTVEIKQ